MNNATIIFNAACELLKQGVIQSTGRLLMRKMPDGSLLEVPEPETIHTYNGWKALGYQVRKGEAPTTASGGNFVGAEVGRNRAAAAVTPPRQLRPRNEHAVAAFPIWKYSGKRDEETGEETDGRCFTKLSHFFTAAQVEKIS